MNDARRALLRGLAVFLAATGGLVDAQPARPARKRVAVCVGPGDARDLAAARKSWAELLSRHGFIDGQQIDISIFRSSSPHPEDYGWIDDAARQVIGINPHVIVARGWYWVLVLMKLTRDIPIISYHVDLESDIIAGLRRPARNLTGVAAPIYEVQEKRLQLMKELRPEARRVGILQVKGTEGPAVHREESKAWLLRHQEKQVAIARRLAMEPVLVPIRREDSADAIVAALRAARVDIVDLMGAPAPAGIWERLAKSGIAAGAPACTRDGCLLDYMSVGTFEILAGLAARVLRGEDVATIPAEQPRQFRLSLNLSTAKALGITVPQSVLLRAHEIVE